MFPPILAMYCHQVIAKRLIEDAKMLAFLAIHARGLFCSKMKNGCRLFLPKMLAY